MGCQGKNTSKGNVVANFREIASFPISQFPRTVAIGNANDDEIGDRVVMMASTATVRVRSGNNRGHKDSINSHDNFDGGM
jgi:hypothetical protein